MKADYFSSDILELLNLLEKYQVEYLIVGGEAVIYYGYPRLTGDIDIFYRNTNENADALFQVLSEFWNNDIPAINDKSELTQQGYVIQFGVPPNRIDLLNEIEGVEFEDAWKEKEYEEIEFNKGQVVVNFLGLKHLIINKEQAGRPKDLDDLDYLRRIE